MAESYLIKKLYERRHTLTDRRQRSKGITLDVSNLLSIDEKHLANRGVTFEVTERLIRANIDYVTDEFDEKLALVMTDWEMLELDGEDLPDDFDSSQVYKLFCDRIVMKMSVRQILRE